MEVRNPPEARGSVAPHKRASVREMIEDADAELQFIPPYSPDFDPIEMAFAKLKALLRKAAERTVDGLWNAIQPPSVNRASSLRHVHLSDHMNGTFRMADNPVSGGA